MSASTVDRLLRPYRDRWPGRGRSLTKPGTLLKRSVPVRTFADWDEACPGFLEIDLVAAMLNKGELAVFEALERLRTRLPFPLLGLDCDNGSEFLNHHLIRWCQAEGITLTRSRPYRKNDNCFIEQKNWSVVRRLVGYARFERHALVRLQAVYAAAEEAVNFLQPVLKLREKVRDGARVIRRYDAARTPYRRLLDHPAALDHGTLATLRDRSEQLHPVRLKLAIEAAQQALYARAVREGPVLSQRMPLEKISL